MLRHQCKHLKGARDDSTMVQMQSKVGSFVKERAAEDFASGWMATVDAIDGLERLVSPDDYRINIYGAKRFTPADRCSVDITVGVQDSLASKDDMALVGS